MTIDPTDVPLALHSLIPLAHRWGIGDDMNRDATVESASTTDLQELVAALSPDVNRQLDDWLAGPEATNPPFTEAYLRYTDLRSAADYASAVLLDR